MSVQARSDQQNFPFILSSEVSSRSVTLAQDAGRSAVLAPFTLMAKVVATQKWVPFTDETATDGTAIPMGIYAGDEVAAADLVAGDVEDAPVYVGGAMATYDNQQLVIENSKLLTTVIPASDATNVYFTQTVADYLENKGLFSELTVDIDELENS